MRISDWSSDVCSSDLGAGRAVLLPGRGHRRSRQRGPLRRVQARPAAGLGVPPPDRMPVMTMTEPDSDQHQTSERRAPRRRLIWIVLAAAAAVAVVVVSAVALGAAGEDPAPPPVTSALPDPPAGADAPAPRKAVV